MSDQPAAGNGKPSLERLGSPEGRRAFTSIYGNLLAAGFGAGSKSLLVCGPSGGEGASTVALGLAVVASGYQGNRVLLVDGNIHHPVLSETLAPPGAPGMQGFLAGSMELDEVKIHPVMPGLEFLGAGIGAGRDIAAPIPAQIPALLAGLRPRYSLIVLDGPAVNRHPESVLYAPFVDQVLLVLHAGVSRGPVVERALAKLTAPMHDRIEIILNRREHAIPEAVYRRLGGYGS
jgi:Mrp family chromosome partitioning ATPase